MEENIDSFLTINKNFDEVKRATMIIMEERGMSEANEIIYKLMKAFDQLEILERAMKHYQNTGGRSKLPKKLKQELAEKLNYSEKSVENIVYKYTK